MTLHTDKGLKSKNVRGQIIAMDTDSKFEIKAKKKFQLEKGLWVTIIQTVVSKTLRLFYKKKDDHRP